jgi:hypothetical protein
MVAARISMLLSVRRIIQIITYYLVGVIVFSSAAIMNGYPLVFSDSGTYLRSAIELQYPGDKPVFYSIFIALLHLKMSLWPIVIGQSLMTAYIIDICLATIDAQCRYWHRIILVIALGALTGLPWFTGQIMPDLFAPLMVLALYVVMVEYRNIGRRTYITLLLFLCLAQAVHYSHILLNVGAPVKPARSRW